MYGKSSAKREYRVENVFLKVDRALSKLITLLIIDKKELNHFFKSRSSDIVQNAKRYQARNTEREARRPVGRAPYARSSLREKRATRMCERSEQIFVITLPFKVSKII